MSRRSSSRPAPWLALILVLAPLLLSLRAAPGVAAALPPAFADDLVAGVSSPTALAFTPDGRMLVAQQTGRLLVYRDGALLATALNLGGSVCSNWERGLLGVAVDPDFNPAANNRYIYLFYTFDKFNTANLCPTNQPTSPVNRVSRFVLSDSNTVTGETVLIDNMPSPNGNHNGGDLNFGKDGFLYATIGDGGCDYAGDSGCSGSNDAARDPNTLLGKVLRITRDGDIPDTNPFRGADSARCNVTGSTTPGIWCQETFAWGLRNPFRLGFDPNAAGTRFFINDVGQSAREEIDNGQAGADYGWHCREGTRTNSIAGKCSPTPLGMIDPIFDYDRTGGCGSITGGAFVPAGVWTAEYDAAYIFADFVCGKFFALRQGSGGGWAATEFAPGQSFGPVYLRFGPYRATQALYYTTYANGGQVRRITLRFSDVPAGHPAYDAVEQLRSRNLVKGYTAAGCAERNVAYPCFGPADTSLRAQMAALIVRAMGWSGEQHPNPFTDREGLVAELWDAVGILAAHGVAYGYGDGRFGPNDDVSQAQVVSFIARAMVAQGHWQPAVADDPAIYPNVPASTGHRLDLVTFVQHVGALPDHPANANWASWNDPATRGWFARVLWQAFTGVLGP